MKKVKGTIISPKGFLAAGIACGIKKSGKKDLALIHSGVPAAAAAVFTTNKFKAAPVIISQHQIRSGIAQTIVVNSGNANAATGKQGIADASSMIDATALALKIPKSNILVASTGIIGEALPMEKIIPGIKKVVQALPKGKGIDAARAILTTDKTIKQIVVKAGDYKIAGITKGSGMICPAMATMLAFITTDAKIDGALLKKMLKQAAQNSFNQLSVDNCMSTNDCVIALANGVSGYEVRGKREEVKFLEALEHVCIYLAKEIARDGEGATKMIEVRVAGARTKKEAALAAKRIINSALFKAAVFGRDLNWGRIIAALGSTRVSYDPNYLDIYAEGIPIFVDGQGHDVTTAQKKRIFKKKDIIFLVDLKVGDCSAEAWGCDLSYDYVKINARYHT
ncbi:bifunctional glutamate N-acetyltransferase/amino-acid acetyltransferase ArgJ [Candidatus Margulisiibacteriota bacterium]